MCLPAIHVNAAAAQLSHLLHTLHELLHPKFREEEVARVEKG